MYNYIYYKYIIHMCIYIYTLYIIQFMPNGGTLQKIMGDGSGHSTLKAGALRST